MEKFDKTLNTIVKTLVEGKCVVRAPIFLANGGWLSVQASEFHDCHPREVLDASKYDSYEVMGRDVKMPESFAHYFCGEFYSKVPRKDLLDFIEDCGGIVDTPQDRNYFMVKLNKEVE